MDTPLAASQEQPIMPTTSGPSMTGTSQSKSTTAPPKKRKNTKRIVWSIILIVIAAAAVWYFLIRKETAAPIVIRYAPIERGEIIQAVTATGTIQATTTVQVGTQVSGTIRALYADFNSKVKKGDLIAVLDPTFYQAAVAQAQANYQKSLADRDHAQKDAERADALFAKDILSKAEHDAAVASLSVSNATVAQSEASLQQAKVNLGYTQIHAPINGTVISRSVDVGQTVAASLNAPVIFIIAEDLAKMQVQAAVDEADIGGVVAGQKVTFTVDAFGEEKFVGVVNSVRLNATITQNVVNYTVVIDADNPDLKLLPSMTATVTIINAEKHNVLKVPVAALRFTPPDLAHRRGSGAAGGSGGASGQRGSRGSGQAGGGNREQATTEADSGTVAGTIYIKHSAKPGDKAVEPTRISVRTGLSDGLFIEVIPTQELNVGDSVAIGSSAPAGGTAGAPGASPFGSPAGGQANRGMRRL